MSATVANILRKGFYLDSVALMRLSRQIAGLPGVADAALMMGTPANRQIMADAGLLGAEGEAAQGSDLVIAVRAEDTGSLEAALAEAERLLEKPSGAVAAGAAWRPRSLRAAVQHLPEAKLALISVPGDFAAAEARKALRRGLHVMLFSDNVALADELALKQEARERGLLVMGPDCGTAILGGLPLAFANRVPRGEIAIVGASGTGMQEIACLIARAGGGISQAVGVGGRDLGRTVGGISTLTALEALEAEAATRHIVLVSKPPDPAVADRVLSRIGAGAKRYTVCFIGAEEMSLPANARQAATLKDAAALAAGELTDSGMPSAAALRDRLPAGGRRVAGLFCGGTLCAEAQVVFRRAGLPVASNAAIPGSAALDAAGGAAHPMVDLGADEYTRGQPHPMIEPAVRDRPLADALADPETAVVLLDLVIGTGAHQDPAGHLVASLPAGGRLPVILASVTGTDADTQNRAAQVARLEAAGIVVAPTNADAAALAAALVRDRS